MSVADYTELYETENFKVLIPPKPFVDRSEGGHLMIYSKLHVSDRTKLNRDQALEYTKLSMIIGEALKLGLAEGGIDIGIVNYQEMGNWSVSEPEGPTMHMHVFGRAKTATRQKYGEAVQLPFRESGFYDGFKPLSNEDQVAIRIAIEELEASPKYKDFK